MKNAILSQEDDLEDIEFETHNENKGIYFQSTIVKDCLDANLGLWFLMIILILFTVFAIYHIVDYQANKNPFDTILDPPANIVEILSSPIYEQPLPYLPADEKKLNAIKEEMKFVWKEYEEHSWGFDFYKPLSQKGSNYFNGGITIIDSIDTLYLMNLTQQYQHAREWIKQNFSISHTLNYSIFEITIRELAGFLSIYQLTNDTMFLEKAELLGEAISSAFLPNGFFFNTISFRNFSYSTNNPINTIADLGSIQLEFDTLASLTKDQSFSLRGTQAHQTIFRLFCQQFVYPSLINTCLTSATIDDVTFDAAADSFYEYLIKLYLLSGGTAQFYLGHFLEAMNILKQKHVKYYPKEKLYYVVSTRNGRITSKMTHLMAYIGAALTMGTVKDNPTKEEDLEYAHNLTMSFVKLYDYFSSGLMPEIIHFNRNISINAIDTLYALRPETIESLFFLYRFTGRKIYRQKAWQIFKRIRSHCKTSHGYASLGDTTSKSGDKLDHMDSYFLAETMKYLYLIFSNSTLIPLSKYVFNTEAHPFRIMDPEQGKKYVPIDTLMEDNNNCLQSSYYEFIKYGEQCSKPRDRNSYERFSRSIHFK